MSIWVRNIPRASNSISFFGGTKGKLIPIKRSLLSESRSVLVRMIEDCRKLGAKEIFVGSDGSDSFQFVTSGETYTGRLPTGTSKSLEKVSFNDYPISLDWSELDIENLKLGITSNGSTFVYCFSWKERVVSLLSNEDSTHSVAEELIAESPLTLIVDDDPKFSKIMSRILEEQNFQTLVALDGKEALAILEGATPSLIITDIHMPHLSGPELLLEIRKRRYEMPCLVLTNDENSLTEAELVILGATAFIRKSEDPRVLLAWCRRLTCLKRVT